MGKQSKPRAGSLQYWPRKKAGKFLPSVNWKILEEKNPDSRLLGFIGYKVSMSSCIVKDLTKDSMTKDKKIALPATILEVPSMKILSVRFYKNNQVVSEILAEAPEKELKKKIKLPKEKKERKTWDLKDYDDIRILAYSLVRQTGIKKTPDIAEIGLRGSREEKLNFVKEHLNKELRVSDFFKPVQLIDVRGLSKGRGFSGPVKRFGIGLKQHKSEKGRRRPGSLGPWHPHYVTFRVPMAGQLGLFSRIQHNVKVLDLGKISEKNINLEQGFENFGKIKTEYAIVSGSIPGTEKRQLLITMPLRKTKKQEKKNYEFIKLI